MCVRQFLCAGVFLCSLAVSLHSEQWYRVSEQELTKLETLSQGSEKDKQSWLSQASELKGKVLTLQMESKTLNTQLAVEREMTQSLRKSFELSASEQLQRASDYESEISRLKEIKAKAENDVLKVKNQRNILLFVLTTIAGLFSVIVFVKVKFFFFK